MRGCSKLLKTATLRHNDAGSLIVEAIYMGEKISQLIAADVGRNKRRKAQGRDTLDITRTLSEAALPDSIPNKLRGKLANLSIPNRTLSYTHSTANNVVENTQWWRSSTAETPSRRTKKPEPLRNTKN
jgi:hypothetical protein